jgi:hypothetical protein
MVVSPENLGLEGENPTEGGMIKVKMGVFQPKLNQEELFTLQKLGILTETFNRRSLPPSKIRHFSGPLQMPC